MVTFLWVTRLMSMFHCMVTFLWVTRWMSRLCGFLVGNKMDVNIMLFLVVYYMDRVLWMPGCPGGSLLGLGLRIRINAECIFVVYTPSP